MKNDLVLQVKITRNYSKAVKLYPDECLKTVHDVNEKQMFLFFYD